MSTTDSIANFYVDKNGQEQPIRYKAADLVNKLAPIGYHWERRNSAEEWNERIWSGPTYGTLLMIKEVRRNDDYYICVKDKE